jgi:hypothetical protein
MAGVDMSTLRSHPEGDPASLTWDSPIQFNDWFNSQVDRKFSVLAGRQMKILESRGMLPTDDRERETVFRALIDDARANPTEWNKAHWEVYETLVNKGGNAGQIAWHQFPEIRRHLSGELPPGTKEALDEVEGVAESDVQKALER